MCTSTGYLKPLFFTYVFYIMSQPFFCHNFLGVVNGLSENFSLKVLFKFSGPILQSYFLSSSPCLSFLLSHHGVWLSFKKVIRTQAHIAKILVSCAKSQIYVIHQSFLYNKKYRYCRIKLIFK